MSAMHQKSQPILAKVSIRGTAPGFSALCDKNEQGSTKSTRPIVYGTVTQIPWCLLIPAFPRLPLNQLPTVAVL